MMEEERWILEEAIMVSNKRQVRGEAMRVERERKVGSGWRTAKDGAARTEAER